MKKAAVAYVTREDGRMLVVWNKRYAGWTMPGGLVEEGETPGVACARELQEETGLISFTYEQVYEAPTEPHFHDGRGTYCHVFSVTQRKIFDEHPRECEVGCAVTWFTREEFLKWCPFAKFYEKMFAQLDKKRRLKRVYIAAPCGGGPDRDANRERAARWCSWALRKRGVSPIADWIVLTSQLSEEYRDLGMAANFAALESCEEIWLVAGRVSPGMVLERDFALDHDILVVDLTHLGEEPPE